MSQQSNDERESCRYVSGEHSLGAFPNPRARPKKKTVMPKQLLPKPEAYAIQEKALGAVSSPHTLVAYGRIHL
jgi:hypothetical protein